MKAKPVRCKTAADARRRALRPIGAAFRAGWSPDTLPTVNPRLLAAWRRGWAEKTETPSLTVREKILPFRNLRRERKKAM